VHNGTSEAFSPLGGPVLGAPTSGGGGPDLRAAGVAPLGFSHVASGHLRHAIINVGHGDG
jgi:hypothetical protein